MYSYEIKDNGFIILRYGRPYMVQLEPHIPNPAISYEENAQEMIAELTKPAPIVVADPMEERLAAIEIAMAGMMGV